MHRFAVMIKLYFEVAQNKRHPEWSPHTLQTMLLFMAELAVSRWREEANRVDFTGFTPEVSLGTPAGSWLRCRVP